jgi:hypothetical protein
VNVTKAKLEGLFADELALLSLEQRQRFQQLFFPEGISFDGNRFVGTRVAAPAFSYLREIETGNERMVDLTGIVPAGEEPKARRRVPERGQVPDD